MSADLIERPWRCDVTGNPVGTDTRMIGAPPCDCQGCRAADALAAKDAALSEMRAELERIHQQKLIDKIAQVSSAVGWQAGVGAMELAGQIISVLHANPEHTERFMNEGVALLHDGTLDIRNGSLTYMAISGEVLSPANLRSSKGGRDQ